MVKLSKHVDDHCRALLPFWSPRLFFPYSANHALENRILTDNPAKLLDQGPSIDVYEQSMNVHTLKASREGSNHISSYSTS